MKTIDVTINAQFVIPDDWDVVEHVPDSTFPDDRLTVLKIKDSYYDFFPECLINENASNNVCSPTDEGKTEDIIDCMKTFKVNIAKTD